MSHRYHVYKLSRYYTVGFSLSSWSLLFESDQYGSGWRIEVGPLMIAKWAFPEDLK